MKHEEIVNHLVAEAEGDPNVLGVLVFGSVALGTQREDSDIDLLTVLQASKPSSGMKHTTLDGIDVGNIFFTHEVLTRSVEAVPYLLHPLASARLLFDRQALVQPLHERIRAYFVENPEITVEWERFRRLLGEEKARYGYEKTTIVDVWNELERRYSAGKTRRTFFNAFYMTNPHLFSILKWLLSLG